MIRLVAGHATDPGRVRLNNQDRIAAIDGLLYAVADGMGGHRGGEVAAEIVATGLEEFATQHTDQQTPTSEPLSEVELDATSDLSRTGIVRTLTAEMVTDQIVVLNESILERAASDDDLHQMGTTLTAIALTETATPVGDRETVIAVFNIGDSRTYLLRNGELQQLTVTTRSLLT